MSTFCLLSNIVFLILAGLLVSIQAGGTISKRSGFREFCNATSKCVRSSWLTCQDGLCDCAKIEEMFYDPGKGKCVSKAGERCKFEIDDNIFERADCVANAKCDTLGVCVCETAFFEISNGTCLGQSGSGDSCVSDVSCRTDKFLKCIDGFCACKADEAEFVQDRCIGLAGAPCLGSQCTSNANCNASGNCTCSNGYFQNLVGRCILKKPRLDTCTNDVECKTENAFFKCWNGTCDCEPNYSKLSRIFVPIVPSVQLSGSSCAYPLNAITVPGIIQAPYYPESSGSYVDCQWLITTEYNETLKLTLDITCCGGIVQVHDGNSRNQRILLETSGSYAPQRVTSTGNEMLIYFNSHYGRGFKAEYETQGKRERFECAGLANQQCNANKNCVRNAFCAESGQCLCNQGYAITSEGICGLSHGNSCNDEDICSDTFICSEGKCTCRHPIHQIYNAGDEKCLSIVSGPCSDDQSCIRGAFCQLNNITGTGYCECKKGFVENKEGICEMIAHGFPCKYKSNACDQLAHLKCRNNVCQCPDESMIFSESERKCLGLVHFRCTKSQGEEYGCIENAKCVVKHDGLSGICKCEDPFAETKDRQCG